MGWLFHPVPPARHHDRNAEIDRIFRPANPDLVTYTILQRSWDGNTCYVACKIENHETGRSEVVAFVILTKSYMEDGQRWWGYKDMDETMGLYHTRAPKSLILKLSPTENKFAQQWRDACLLNSVARATPRPTKFKTSNPLSFTFQTLGRRTAQMFEKVSLHGRRNVYKCLDLPGEPLVRLGRIDWSKVEPLA